MKIKTTVILRPYQFYRNRVPSKGRDHWKHTHRGQAHSISSTLQSQEITLIEELYEETTWEKKMQITAYSLLDTWESSHEAQDPNQSLFHC